MFDRQEVRALISEEAYWKMRARSAETRLAQIAELVDDALPAEYAGNVYVDAEHYRSIQRLAHGEEASSERPGTHG